MSQKTKAKNDQNSQTQFYMVSGIVVLVIALVAGFFVLQSNNTASDTFDYSNIPQERTQDGAFILGDPDAPVTIVAWEDFLCPHCQGYQPVLKQFFEDYVATGKARFEYRILPAVHPTFSSYAASLAECADENGSSFWEAHDALYDIASSEQFNDGSARKLAERIDVSYADLLECAGDAEQWQIDQQLAAQNNISGTPFVVLRVDGELLQGRISQRPSIGELGAVVESYQ